jgi:16S rRNA pseudouridine516 synthase
VLRLDKVLAHSGFGSRKDVKKLVKQHLVKVNGATINDSAHKVDPHKDRIFVGDVLVRFEEYIYIMMNKPCGVVSANQDDYHQTVFDLLEENYPHNLFCVGRLDIDTTGLLLLTNDGRLAHQLLSPKNKVNKLYKAHINGIITDKHIEMFQAGILLADHLCMPATLSIIEQGSAESYVALQLKEGKFHQVKRMFTALGFQVLSLQRIKMNNLELDPSLELGSYRLLSSLEVADLKKYNDTSYPLVDDSRRKI